MKRRQVLKGIAGLATSGLTSALMYPRHVHAAPAKVRVTLVRWPYT